MTGAHALPLSVKALVELKEMGLEEVGVSAGAPLLTTGQVMCNEAITWMMFACIANYGARIHWKHNIVVV